MPLRSVRGLHFTWEFDNAKLTSIGALGFGLPPLTTCPGAAWCASICFARRGWYGTERVKARLQHNLAVVLGTPPDELVERLVEDLERLARFEVIRVHFAGDFYSALYLSVWYRVARRLPTRLFYAYTKSVHLPNLWSERPPNFVVVQSEGGKFDHLIDPTQPTARIFPTLEDLVRAGYANGQHSDLPAASGDLRVGLVYHGGRLTRRAGKLLDCVPRVPPPNEPAGS